MILFPRHGTAGIVFDQAASSVTNALLMVMAARSLSGYDIGLVALAFTAVTFFTSLTRAGLSYQYAVVESSEGRHISDALAPALLLATLVGSACILVGLSSPRSSQTLLLVFGASLPPITVWEGYRPLAFASGRTDIALAGDLLWLGTVIVGAFYILVSGTRTTPAVVYLLWGGPTLPLGAAVVLRYQLVQRVPGALGWAWSHRRSIAALSAEVLINRGVREGVLLLSPAVIGLSTLGALRVAMTAIGPLTVAAQAVASIGVARAYQFRQSQGALHVRRIHGGSMVLGTAGAGILGLVLWPFGGLLFGEVWRDARPAVPGLLVLSVAIISVSATAMAARARRGPRAALRVRVRSEMMFGLFAVLGLFGGSLLSTTIGMAIGGIMTAVVWYRVATT